MKKEPQATADSEIYKQSISHPIILTQLPVELFTFVKLMVAKSKNTDFMKVMFVIVSMLLSSIAWGQTSDTYKSYFDSLIILEQYDELIRFFEGELTKYPKSEDILRSIGYVHIAKNNLDIGEKYYNEALVINPNCARCFINIGRIYALRGNQRKALEYSNKAILLDSTDARLYAFRANVKVELKDKLGALGDFNKAIDFDSTNFEHYINRGKYLANINYQAMAIADMDKAVSLAPQSYYPYYQRSSIYYSQKEYDEALEDINKAIALDSSQSQLYSDRGAINEALQVYQKAIDDYSKAIQLNKREYIPYLFRAGVYYKMEDLDGSCTDFEVLKTLIESGVITDKAMITEINATSENICNPSKPSYFYQRGVGFYNLKSYQKALDIYAKGLELFPDNAMMLSFKGNAHMALNEYEQAIFCYNESLKHKENMIIEIKENPRFADATTETITSFYDGSLASSYFGLAECKVNLGFIDDALLEINQAIDLLPKKVKDYNPETYYNLRGHIYLAKGSYDLAMLDFNQSVLLNKDYPVAYVNRAITKVCLAEKVQYSSFTLRGNFSSQPLNINWGSPTKASLAKSEANLISALYECNYAIKLDKQFGFAYYIRGQIKLMLGHSDYCIDFLTAKELGLTVEPELLKNCGK
jgi:tetratricopeptide (TPR) repeat protein